MTRVDITRSQIQQLLRDVPFRPFALSLENGDRIVIEHPENIAFDPTANGRQDIYIITNRLRLFTTFEAVSSVALLDHGEPAA
jgi:hypothetical protein